MKKKNRIGRKQKQRHGNQKHSETLSKKDKHINEHKKKCKAG